MDAKDAAPVKVPIYNNPAAEVVIYEEAERLELMCSASVDEKYASYFSMTHVDRIALNMKSSRWRIWKIDLTALALLDAMLGVSVATLFKKPVALELPPQLPGQVEEKKEVEVGPFKVIRNPKLKHVHFPEDLKYRRLAIIERKMHLLCIGKVYFEPDAHGDIPADWVEKLTALSEAELTYLHTNRILYHLKAPVS
ncbi:Hypothetical protein POVN_LOCUS79 [uncultured virus]|nr:Hypothetical protein POVN_LOCUS79 [uncultured virus]